MIKVEVIERFSLGRFDELINIKRAGIDTKGVLYVGDTFECSSDMVKYLTGENALNKKVVKVIEVIPEEIKEDIMPIGESAQPIEKVIEAKIEELKPKKKKSTKKNSK